MSESKKLVTTPGVEKSLEILEGVFHWHVPVVDHLCILELKDAPVPDDFRIVRAYHWAPINSGTTYGDHAHLSGREIFQCLGGQIYVDLDDGEVNNSTVLSRGACLFIPEGVWHKIRITSPEAHMVVYADTSYDRETHYVEDYDAFRKLKLKQKQNMH